jgi:SAM-dependent methyltransferase
MMLCEVLLAKRTWTGQGLDISPAAIRYAQGLATHKGVAERAGFLTGDISQLPFATESLDLLIASEVVEHIPDPAQVIREMARVLRPGGRLILTMPLESHTPAHAHTLDGPDDFRFLCEDAGLRVERLKSKWHFGYGDDNKHIFAVARKPVWANAREEDQSCTLHNGLSTTSAFA